ncbi:MAG: helix-turn-helix transcriptional regulator [Anaerorhabdus sp.]|uniref:helix-turn-helix domain-containing protein n=2 Tax=Anaerorhabdus sp. TaxID=1872524 RepID=UPI002FC75B8C
MNEQNTKINQWLIKRVVNLISTQLYSMDMSVRIEVSNGRLIKRGENMKINEIIKKKRKELGLTQEEIATALNVSTPAVNKWETGNSYPDITQLPSLARLLKIDINTLLDFQKEISREEMGEIVNRISEIGYVDFDKAYAIAIEALYEYPNNDELAVSIVGVLKGLLMMVPVDNPEAVHSKIDEILMKVIESQDIQSKSYAAQMLVVDALQKKNFEDAKMYLEKIPEIRFDKKPLELSVYRAQENDSAALELIEKEIFSFSNKLESYLFNLHEIASKKNNLEDMAYYRNLLIDFTRLFGINDYIPCIIEFRENILAGDRDKMLDSIEKLTTELEKPLGSEIKKIYEHVPMKNKNQQFTNTMIQSILIQISKDEETRCLMEDPRFLKLVAKYDEVS